MDDKLSELVGLLDLETLDDSLFRGQNLQLPSRNIYGGQVVAQALVAAERTVAEGVPHSLHAYFLRAGDWSKPVIYEVDRVRDGRSFTSRYVRAIQHGEVILSMIASFQRPEPGLEHQYPMPDVPPPEDLPSLAEVIDELAGSRPIGGERQAPYTSSRSWPIHIRPTNPARTKARGHHPPQDAMWFKAAGPMPDDPLLHRAVLSYASDFDFLSTSLLPHGGRQIMWDGMIIASIDHAIWFHRDARVDDWLLYTMDSPAAQGARGFARGQIFDRQGRLVASTAQEGLIRVVPSKPRS